MGERQSIAQKGVRAIGARNSWLANGSNAAKISVRSPGLSTDEREHPFVCDTLGLAERILHERTPIARFESQHNEGRVCED